VLFIVKAKYSKFIIYISEGGRM